MKFNAVILLFLTLFVSACTNPTYPEAKASFHNNFVSFDYPTYWDLEELSLGDGDKLLSIEGPRKASMLLFIFKGDPNELISVNDFVDSLYQRAEEVKHTSVTHSGREKYEVERRIVGVNNKGIAENYDVSTEKGSLSFFAETFAVEKPWGKVFFTVEGLQLERSRLTGYSSDLLNSLSLSDNILVGKKYAADISSESIDKLMKLSGFDEQIAQLPTLIKESVELGMNRHGLQNTAVHQHMLSSIEKTIHSSILRRRAAEKLKINMTEDKLQSLLTWYQSDVGKKFTAMEGTLYQPGITSTIQAQSDSLLDQSERLSYARRFDQLIQATKTNIQLLEHSQLALKASSVTQQQTDFGTLQNQVRAEVYQKKTAVQNMVWASYIYAHQNANLDQLEQYGRFLKSPAAQQFHRLVNQVIYDAFEELIEQWSDGLPLKNS